MSNDSAVSSPPREIEAGVDKAHPAEDGRTSLQVGSSSALPSSTKIAGAAANRPRSPFGFTFIAPLVLGSVLNPINSTMLATALVPIAESLGTDIAATGWLIAALYLTTLKRYRFKDTNLPDGAFIRAGMKELEGTRILNEKVPVQ